MFKKIISAILVVAMLLTLSVALFSCKDKKNDEKDDTPKEETPDNTQDTGNGKTKYTVTVVDEDGNPVEGVEITFHFESGTDMPFDTDENGQVSQNLSSKVKASVTDLPKGYTYDKMEEEQSFDANGKLTITIAKEEEKAPLVILVVDQYGNPIQGIDVQACDSEGACRIPTTTDAEGKGYYSYEDTELHAKLSSKLPEGYSVADPDQYYDFVGGVATIVITKAE